MEEFLSRRGAQPLLPPIAWICVHLDCRFFVSCFFFSSYLFVSYSLVFFVSHGSISCIFFFLGFYVGSGSYLGPTYADQW